CFYRRRIKYIIKSILGGKAVNSSFNERTPPHNLEAEQAVIGAIFLEPQAFSTASERLISTDFYRANHQSIFATMSALSEKGEPIDVVTVTTDLASSVPTAANIDYYSKIVEEKAVLRRLIKSATDIVTNTFAKEDAIEEVLDEAEKTILEVSSRKNVGAFKPIKDVLIDVYD